MKLFFVKGNSAYTIFKTIDKIPKNKTVEIFIDPEHELLDDQWWGKQFKDKFKEKNIDAIFVTKNERCKHFFEQAGFKVKYQGNSRIAQGLKTLYTFLFNIKKFHLHTLNTDEDKKSRYTFFIVVGFEILFVLLILFLLYMLILPTTTVRLTQSQDSDTIIYNFRYYPSSDSKNYAASSRYISIPYYTGYLDYKYDLSIEIGNIRHLQEPAKGSIKIINKIPHAYDFVPQTKFVTSNGLLFKSLQRIHIPPAYGNLPGEVTIPVKAMERDVDGLIMGNRGLIKANTELYVKNFKPSLFLKKMIAVSLEDFKSPGIESGTTIVPKIIQNDIKILSGELHKYIPKNKLKLTKKVFNMEDAVLLNFDNTTHYEILDTFFDQEVGTKSDKVSGNIRARLHFFYVKWEDLKEAFQKYISQRPMKTNAVLSLDKNSFYVFDDIQKKGDTYIIPTKIDIIKGYDFKKDLNSIIPNIKNYIVGKRKIEARDFILKYPEISTVKINISPIWYSTIPKIKSRIKIVPE